MSHLTFTRPFQPFFEYLSAGAMSRERQFMADIAATGLPLLSYLVSSYRRWLELGLGDLPSNPVGYFINLALQTFARADVRAPTPYTLEGLELVYGAVSRQTFFSPAGRLPPEHVGVRPSVH